MSDRPKWMPSRESLLSLAHNETLYADCGHDYAGEELEEMVKAASIRAQIAVLEEMWKEFGPVDGLWTGDNPPERVWVEERLAALKESLA